MRSSRPPAATGYALLVAMIALFAASKAVVYGTIDPDCFWHLRVGEQLLREGIHPITDSLSFASIRQPWVPYSWLAEIGMAKLWGAGGFRAAVAGAAILQALFVVFIALGCGEIIRARQSVQGDLADQRWFSRMIAVAFATFLSLPYMSFRPVTAALVLLALIAWLLLRDRRRDAKPSELPPPPSPGQEHSRSVWLILPITALLANIHFFVFLVPLWVACLLGGSIWEKYRCAHQEDIAEHSHRVRRYALMFLLTLLCAAATPLLPGVLQSIFHYTVSDPMIRSSFIGEMQPFYTGSMGKISLVLVLIFAACVWMKQDLLRSGERLWLLSGALLLMQMGRMAPVFAIIAGPVFALTLPTLSDRLLGRRSIQFATAAVLALGLFRIAHDFPRGNTPMAQWLDRLGPDAPGYPTTSAEFVALHIAPTTGRIVNEFGWGGYLEWRLGNRFQVLLDGRTQLFTPEFWKSVYLNGDDVRRQYLATINADVAILPLNGSILRSALISLGWQSVHRDDRAEVLVPPTSELVEIER